MLIFQVSGSMAFFHVFVVQYSAPSFPEWGNSIHCIILLQVLEYRERQLHRNCTYPFTEPFLSFLLYHLCCQALVTMYLILILMLSFRSG